MRIKVLFLVSTLESGGPTNVIFNIVKYIDRDIIEPMILTMSEEPVKSRKHDFEAINVPVYQLNQSRTGWMLSGGRKLVQFMATLGPHVIHSHSLRPDIAASALRGYKRMATLHANLLVNYSDTYGRIIGTYFSSSQLKADRAMDMVVACSRSVFEHYRDILPGLRCIQNGVDQQLFRPAVQTERWAIREKLGLPQDTCLFITVGSLIPRKDPITVMDGFLKSNVKGSLVILGKGPLEETVRAYASRNPSIIYAGYSTVIDQYVKASDYFISAALSEGLPNSVMEAMACGLPVCLSNIDSHREILDLNTEAGCFFEAGDSRSVSDAIHKLVASDYGQQSAASLQIISSSLNAMSMASHYQRAYQELCPNVT